MASAKERDQFIAQMVRALPSVPVQHVTEAARLILRHAKTHGRIAEAQCNGHPLQSVSPPNGCDMQAWNARVNKAQDAHDAYCEKREKQIERRIAELAEQIGVKAYFGGDPRGYTVKLHLPSGAYNTWGGAESGYGVPQ